MKAIFFDVDGVLVDSMSQHLAICRDKAREYGVQHAQVPDIAGFRQMVDEGVKVSPMQVLFLACGFSDAQAEAAVRDYDRDFMSQYRPRAYPGIEQMLRSLRDQGYELGLVTANVRANVVPLLGAGFSILNPAACFFLDSFEQPRPKADMLELGARALACEAGECLYVGDQPADASAAAQAGFRFLAVNYGWGFQRPTPPHAATSVTDIPQRVQAGEFSA